jgi:transposase
MRASTPALNVTDPQREVLETLSRSQTAAHRDVQRAQALLMASDGFATTRVAKEIGVSPATVTRWRECFERDGLKASLKVAPGRGRKPSIAPQKVAEIVHATLHETPPGETHWSCRSMARAHGVSHTTVQKIWAARGLKPHRVQTFKLSTDPRFEEKLADVVGLYLHPPERAIVLSMDEKSQIQGVKTKRDEGPE